MGEIKQGNDGNWYEKTAGGWIPAAAPGDGSSPSGPPSSGMFRDLVEGVAVAGGKAVDAFNNAAMNLSFNPYGYGDTGGYVEGNADRISEATAEDPTRMRVSGEGLGNAMLSVPLIAATGGATAPVLASNFVGGVTGALAADEARRHGAGPLGQFGAGFAGDLIGGGLTRGLISAPGAFRSHVMPSARAGKYVAPLGLGEEGADDVASAIRAKYAADSDAVGDAYKAYEAIPSSGATSGSGISKMAASQIEDFKYSPEDIPSISKVVANEVGDQVDIEEIRKIRRGAASAARNRNLTSTARTLAGDFVEESENALMEIAKQSPDDAASAKALLSAIEKRKKLGADFPSKSGLFRLVVDRDNLTPEDAQNAFTKFIRSQDRDKEITIALNAARGDEAAMRGLKKALVLGILNSSEETATSRVSSRLDQLDKAAGTMKRVLGEEGFKHFRGLIAEQATGNQKRGFIWRMMAKKGNPSKGLIAGSVLGGQIGGPETAALGAVVGTGADLIAQSLSPRAVREIAIESLYDPALYRQITRPVPTGPAGKEWLAVMLGSLGRRGLVSAEDALEVER